MFFYFFKKDVFHTFDEKWKNIAEKSEKFEKGQNIGKFSKLFFIDVSPLHQKPCFC